MMINGTAAKVTNLIVAALAAICVIGIVILGIDSRPIPAEITMVITSCIGFLIGTKVTPYGYTTKEVQDVHKDDVITVKEQHKPGEAP